MRNIFYISVFLAFWGLGARLFRAELFTGGYCLGGNQRRHRQSKIFKQEVYQQRQSPDYH